MFRCLYIHVPYCLHKCGYCDFNSFATDVDAPEFPARAERYVHALLKELDLWAEWWSVRERAMDASDAAFVASETPLTIFMGGGTPTTLPLPVLRKLIDGIAARLPAEIPVREWTVEANPETASEELLAYLTSSPVTRVSFGIQSFQPSLLAKLERQHTPEQSLRLLHLLSQQTALQWSGDFIYGIPGQTTDVFFNDLDRYLSYGAQHLSAYQLTLTPGHVLHSQLPPEDELADWFFQVREKLSSAGLPAYETSNFSAHEEKRSFHNLNYWKSHYFLGIGAGAASFFPVHAYGCIGKNVTDPSQYVAKVEADQLPVQWERPLLREEAIQQWLSLGLRTSAGCSWSAARERFDLGLENFSAEKIAQFQTQGWLHTTTAGLSFKEKGHALADTAVSRLIDALKT